MRALVLLCALFFGLALRAELAGEDGSRLVAVAAAKDGGGGEGGDGGGGDDGGDDGSDDADDDEDKDDEDEDDAHGDTGSGR